MAIDTCGGGRGGGGRGRGCRRDVPWGPGEGRGRGGGAGRGSDGRGNNHYSPRQRSSFRTTHETTVGGAALNQCKLSDGSWPVEAIMDGKCDPECMLQTHIDKTYYPEIKWKKLEPCERRKVFLNRGAVARTTQSVIDGTARPLCKDERYLVLVPRPSRDEG